MCRNYQSLGKNHQRELGRTVLGAEIFYPLTGQSRKALVDTLHLGAAGMSQRLRALGVLSEDLGLLPCTHMAAHNKLYFNSRGSNSLLLSLKMPAMHRVCKHTHR